MAYYKICVKFDLKGPFIFGPQGHQGPIFTLKSNKKVALKSFMWLQSKLSSKIGKNLKFNTFWDKKAPKCSPRVRVWASLTYTWNYLWYTCNPSFSNFSSGTNEKWMTSKLIILSRRLQLMVVCTALSQHADHYLADIESDDHPEVLTRKYLWTKTKKTKLQSVGNGDKSHLFQAIYNSCNTEYVLCKWRTKKSLGQNVVSCEKNTHMVYTLGS